MPANPTQGAWKVTLQQESVGLDLQSRAVEGYKVYFETGMGHSGSVFVPKDRFNVDNVRSAVKAAAAMLDQTGALTG